MAALLPSRRRSAGRFQIFGAFDHDDRDAIRSALAAYVNSLGYLQNMKYGAERIGLHGKPCWKVSNEEAEAAGNRIKSRQDCLERQRKRLHAANAEKPRLSLGRRS